MILKDFQINLFSNEEKWLMLTVVLYTLILLLIRTGCWIPYIKDIDDDLRQSSGIASVMPESILNEIIDSKAKKHK